MKEDVVVVIRTEVGDDILAIIHGEQNGIIKIECPYYVRFNHSTSSVVMIPYCSLSDERFYEIDKEKTQFVVVANGDITKKFLNMVDDLTLDPYGSVDDFLQDDSAESQIVSTLKGSDTKH